MADHWTDVIHLGVVDLKTYRGPVYWPLGIVNRLTSVGLRHGQLVCCDENFDMHRISPAFLVPDLDTHEGMARALLGCPAVFRGMLGALLARGHIDAADRTRIAHWLNEAKVRE